MNQCARSGLPASASPAASKACAALIMARSLESDSWVMQTPASTLPLIVEHCVRFAMLIAQVVEWRALAPASTIPFLAAQYAVSLAKTVDFF